MKTKADKIVNAGIEAQGNCRHCHHNHSHSHSHSHSHAHNHSHGHSEKGFLLRYWAELLTGLLFGLGFIPSLSSWWWYAIAVLPVGLPILRETAETWLHGDFLNEFTLMVGAAIGAFIIGEYPEGVAVLLFYSIGEKLEDDAGNEVKRRISKLLGRLPERARVIQSDGSAHDQDPKEVTPGTRIRVLPGEKVPIDGVLLNPAEASFDTSAITGESVPRGYSEGEEVLSGMIPIESPVEFKTTRAFADSSLSRIMRMVEEGAEQKSKTETMLRRITRWYTPIVFILAILVFVVPWIISLCGGPAFDWENWLNRSLIFLVCSCPCALVVSVPLSYFIAIGTASRMGLLIKGGRWLDALRRADTAVFDKTGTLTTGEFHVTGIQPFDALGNAPFKSICARYPGPQECLLGLAASVDALSTHPLARAIVKRSAELRLPTVEAGEIKNVPHGITGRLSDGRKILVGSRKLLEHEIVPDAAGDKDSGETEILVAIDGTPVGRLLLADSVKPEANGSINELRIDGIRNIMILSGDRPAAVSRVAATVGADSFQGSLLPDDKQQTISRLSSEGRRVVFIGDGVNDAPSLATADVGVAMGGVGTGLAMESADIIIAGDSLHRLPQALRLSKRVNATVLQNVTFAIGVKIVVMMLGAFGIASLWAAVFADTGVTLLTILWTLIRLRRLH